MPVLIYLALLSAAAAAFRSWHNLPTALINLAMCMCKQANKDHWLAFHFPGSRTLANEGLGR